MLSYWENKSFVEYHLIIIGSGIVGMSTAIQYKMKHPDHSVLLLERGLFPSGASTRNAGFACFGSLTEILDDLEHLSETETLNLIEKRWDGLLAIRDFFGDEALGFQPLGGYELLTENELPCLEQMECINKMLSPIFNEDVYEVLPSIESFKFSNAIQKIILNKKEGQLDSGKFLKSLWESCQRFGIAIITGAEVESVDYERKEILVNNKVYQKKVKFRANKIALCTNAFTKNLLPDIQLEPGRGMIMVTAPVEKAWNGAFHFDKGYVYFRDIGDRIMLGGGRNIDFETEKTNAPGINPIIKKYLLGLLNDVILPGQSPEIEMEWSGTMAFGPNKVPVIKLINEDVALGVRMGGMGVAIGWKSATELVNLL